MLTSRRRTFLTPPVKIKSLSITDWEINLKLVVKGFTVCNYTGDIDVPLNGMVRESLESYSGSMNGWYYDSSNTRIHVTDSTSYSGTIYELSVYFNPYGTLLLDNGSSFTGYLRNFKDDVDNPLSFGFDKILLHIVGNNVPSSFSTGYSYSNGLSKSYLRLTSSLSSNQTGGNFYTTVRSDSLGSPSVCQGWIQDSTKSINIWSDSALRIYNDLFLRTAY